MWPPDRSPLLKCRTREEQVAALTIPPPPPPPRRNSTTQPPTNQPQPPPEALVSTDAVESSSKPSAWTAEHDTSLAALQVGELCLWSCHLSHTPRTTKAGNTLQMHTGYTHLHARIEPHPPPPPRALSNETFTPSPEVVILHCRRAAMNSQTHYPGSACVALSENVLAVFCQQPKSSLDAPEQGWSPLQSSGLSWGASHGAPFIAAANGDVAEQAPQPPAESALNSMLSSSGPLDSSALSAVAAHYMQKAEAAPSLNGSSISSPTFDQSTVIAAFSGLGPNHAPEPQSQQSHMWALFPKAGRSAHNAAAHAEDDNVCVICLDRKPAGAALVPCGHTQLCLPCARALVYSNHSCPICRHPIEDLLEMQ